ncbi:T9SS type A sorting domain-containing protein [Prolixibacteraceae bacterium Z1-6]|uniref:T9SS type A sorting domain-containing protein n=1 Tax=Draconibacterium aestuarii TaxID=2998507 RepID=A0A9X3FD72_9BACT|nr:T9SS type A sorting domain-containing protein [Prolixibacteraceae bacterium Z1-6]
MIILIFAFAARSQESLFITTGELTLIPKSGIAVAAVYKNSKGQISDVNITWHVKPSYLGKVNINGTLTTNHQGEGYLIANYRGIKDSVKLVVTESPGNNVKGKKGDYPKVEIVPGNIKVEVGDPVELYGFYMNSKDKKADTTITWLIEPKELGAFPDPTHSIFHAGNKTGKGIIIAQLGDIADTAKIEVYESKWKKDQREKISQYNIGTNGQQLTIAPNDQTVYKGADPIQYLATYKIDGTKQRGTKFKWSVSDPNIATINSDGLLTLVGKTGMTLVTAECNNMIKSAELLVIDSMTDSKINNIWIHRVLPNGKELQVKTVKEGESYKISGLPYPLNILNGGMIHFPVGCINEDIVIYIFIPEEYATIDNRNTNVSFSDEIVAGIKFSVKPVGSDNIVEPYWFNIPIELKLVYKQELLDSLNLVPQNLNVFFANKTGFTKVNDKTTTIDTAGHRIYASIAHFSTIVVKESKAFTSLPITPSSEHLLYIYPNPFNSSSTIQFSLANAGKVNITIYNIFGQPVQILANGEYSEGLHMVSWQGNDFNGSPAPSGMYLCRFIKDGEVSQVKRIILKR